MKKELFKKGTMSLGVNYWASHGATRMWTEWDETIVEKDIKNLAQIGCEYLRVFPSGREIPEKRFHMGLGYEKMFDFYDYTCYTFKEFKQKYCPEKKEISKNLYEVLGKDLTDKFSMYLLIHNGELKTYKKYRIAIITSGKGTIDGLEVQKGDRVFIKDEKTVNINGDNEFEVVICE